MAFANLYWGCVQQQLQSTGEIFFLFCDVISSEKAEGQSCFFVHSWPALVSMAHLWKFSRIVSSTPFEMCLYGLKSSIHLAQSLQG